MTTAREFAAKYVRVEPAGEDELSHVMQEIKKAATGTYTVPGRVSGRLVYGFADGSSFDSETLEVDSPVNLPFEVL